MISPLVSFVIFFFFFFQAEDGIRDKLVTGVQTCALPISSVRGTQIGPSVNRNPPASFSIFVPDETISSSAGSFLMICAGVSLIATLGEIGRASCRERV